MRRKEARVIEVLERTRELLGSGHHVQIQMAADRYGKSVGVFSPHAHRFCLVGALTRESGWFKRGLYEASEQLALSMGGNYSNRYGTRGRLMFFNDDGTGSTSTKRVLGLIDKTLERLRPSPQATNIGKPNKWRRYEPVEEPAHAPEPEKEPSSPTPPKETPAPEREPAVPVGHR